MLAAHGSLRKAPVCIFSRISPVFFKKAESSEAVKLVQVGEKAKLMAKFFLETIQEVPFSLARKPTRPKHARFCNVRFANIGKARKLWSSFIIKCKNGDKKGDAKFFGTSFFSNFAAEKERGKDNMAESMRQKGLIRRRKTA